MQIVWLFRDCIRDRFWIRKALILILWVLGLLTGCILVKKAATSSFSQMRMLVNSHVSIFSVLLITFFPLVISAIALWFSKPWLLLPLAFTKAFLFGFVSSCVMVAFGNAAWLVRWFVLFTDSVMSVCYLWLWLKEGTSDNINGLLLTSIFASIVVCSLDYFAVSPYLCMLFDH